MTTRPSELDLFDRGRCLNTLVCYWQIKLDPDEVELRLIELLSSIFHQHYYSQRVTDLKPFQSDEISDAVLNVFIQKIGFSPERASRLSNWVLKNTELLLRFCRPWPSSLVVPTASKSSVLCEDVATPSPMNRSDGTGTPEGVDGA